MAESTIITGQFVRISQTPASIGERLLALVIDYSLIVIYLYSVTTLIVKLHLLVPLRNVQSRAEFRKTSDEYTRRKIRRFYSQHQCLSAALASLHH